MNKFPPAESPVTTQSRSEHDDRKQADGIAA